jgi:cold shock CspA family protein
MNKNLNDPLETKNNVLDIDSLNVINDEELADMRLNNQAVYKKIKCFVKWFKQEDGYGFLKSKSLNKEIFIHSSVLDPTSVNNMMPGDLLVCTVIQGMRGPQVDKVHSYTPQQLDQEELITGSIKWFNIKSDFGFIKGTKESGDRDIFLSGKKVRSVGFKPEQITPNQVVMFTFKSDISDNFIVNKLKFPNVNEAA